METQPVPKQRSVLLLAFSILNGAGGFSDPLGALPLFSLSLLFCPPPQAKPHTHEDRAGDRDPVGQTQVVLPVPTPQAVLKGLLVQKLLSFGNLMRLIQYLLLVL